jgi:hypothetical protein
LSDRLIDHTVVDIKLEADFEVPNARLVLKSMLQKVVDLATTKPRESGQLMDNDNVDLLISDRVTESAILCATLVVSPRDDVSKALDARVRILLANKLLKLTDLSLVVLAVG